ncbi:uncharacterized protein LOC129949815 [Eupeodes corollae]|uniref:uncharacterized protein LOC129949815 n=1 Tax=Eupeodes corollae TaxID=290404 RepID=UPI002490377D|nr:uncharacterized protein LOC129949815 [Eupeodes corollae]
MTKKPNTVSWVPIYNIVSWILFSSMLNYFSNSFCDKKWKSVLMGSIFSFQMFIGVLCLAGIFLPNKYDLEDLISCLIIFFTEASIGLKAITLIYHSASLKKLSEIIMKETSRTDLKPWELKLAKNYKKYSEWILIKVLILYDLTMVSFIGAPLFSKKEYMMPILMEFPATNSSTSLGFGINYAFGAYSVFYGTTVEMGFDIPAFLQACFISYQLDKCIHFCKMIGDFDSPYNTHDKQSKLLRKCVKLHATIFKFINEVSTINTFVVALTVITIVPLLTVLLYSILMGTISGAPFMMAACAYHLFMYCFLGEIVSNKCIEASNAIYSSKWYKIEKPEDKRTIMIFLTISQCNMGFSAGGLYKLSLATFTELTRRVYGACAFLQKVL